MRILRTEIFKKIDEYCIEKLMIPEFVLVENAAVKIVNNVDLSKNLFVIVCGVGNNGGDGFAVARHLIALSKSVKVFFVGMLEKMGKCCEMNYNILKNMGVQIENISDLQGNSIFIEELVKSDITIDALFGTGLSRKVEGIYKAVINAINENSNYIISIDVPSGLNSDTGDVMGSSVRSNKTVTFQALKEGFLNYEAEAYTGEVIVENIGIPEIVMEKFCEKKYISDKTLILKCFVKRNKYAHKGDFGRTLVFAGSKGYTGAAYICTEAAVKSGSGLTTLCCPDNIQAILGGKLTEAMTVPNSDRARIAELIEKSNAIAFGPGMGLNEDTYAKLQYVLGEAECPIVIDADGINALKDSLDLLKDKKATVIVTPHAGEMSRLTKLPIEYINQNRMKAAEEFAKRYDIIVLLKGYNTVITDGKTTFINPTGSSAMASGGMGDCLTGIIAAFLAEGQDAMSAVLSAAYVHGYIGEKLSENMHSVTASDVIKQIPYAIKELEN